MERVDLSQSSARVLIRMADELRVSQSSARMMTRAPMQADVSLSGFRGLIRYQPLTVQAFRFSQGKARILVRLSPNFRWVDMFTDIVFPNDIGQNSDASTRFNTLVNQVASGHDQRIALWDYPLMEYNVAYGVRTMEQLHDLIRLFRAMRGRLNSFRFLDKIDYTSTFAVLEESRSPEEISPTDQQIGTGDGETTSFQLVKHYDFDGETATRPIYKPIWDTVLVAVNGEEIFHFECDYSTGIVTIVPRVDVEVPGATLTYIGGTTWSITVVGDPGDPTTYLPLLKAGEYFGVTGFGAEILRGVVVGSPEPSTTEVRFTWPKGTPSAEPELAVGNIRIVTDNTPRVGDVVTAGYHFHVPVRFDSDRIPVKLEYYGIGSASEVKLVEVRPDEE